MSQIKIKERETEEYALNQPTMIRVRIADGKVLEDKRAKHFPLTHSVLRHKQGGLLSSDQ